MHGRFAAVALMLVVLLVAVLALRAQRKTADTAPPPWYQHAVFYEIYPRSFMDSNGDGIGDLNGIASKLDYLQALGVDAIWIAPCFPSPQVDFGYDVSDYENIDKMYGTLADFDRLQKLGADHGIKIILDFVVNHTSDQHPWFVDSRSSRTSAEARLVHLARRQGRRQARWRKMTRRTTGSQYSAARHGSGTAPPNSTTTIISTRSSRT